MSWKSIVDFVAAVSISANISATITIGTVQHLSAVAVAGLVGLAGFMWLSIRFGNLKNNP